MSTRPERKSKFTAAAAMEEVIELGDIESMCRQAKLAAARLAYPCAPAVRAMTLVFPKNTKGLTMGIDKYYRVYIGSEWVAEQEAAARAVSPASPCRTCGQTAHHPLAYIGGTMLHEAWHLLRNHHKRFADTGFTLHQKWNIAADLELNDDIMVLLADTDKPRLCLPTGGIWPARMRSIPVEAKAWETSPNKAAYEAAKAAAILAQDVDQADAAWDALTPQDRDGAYAHDQVSKYGDTLWASFTDNKLAEEYYLLLPEPPPCPVHGKPGQGQPASGQGQTPGQG